MRPCRVSLAAVAGSIAVLTVAALAPAGAATGPVIQIDVSSVLDSDVVVNTDAGTGSGLDETQDAVDPPNDNYYATQSAMDVICVDDPQGLPDDGFFPENADHPDVQLNYTDSDSGLNARRLSNEGDSSSFAVPAAQYSELHLFAAAGNGSADMVVTLQYATGAPVSTTVLVKDWFDDADPDGYLLIDLMDRALADGPFDCNDVNTVAIFGFSIPVDSARVLTGVEIERAEGGEEASIVFFGATAVQVPAAPAPSLTVTFTG